MTGKPSLSTTEPVKRFRPGLDLSASLTTPFDVYPDGKRFLVQMPVSDVMPPINVILNWQELLGK